MTPSDINKILSAIGELKVDIAVIKEGNKSNEDHGKRIRRLELTVTALIVAFAAAGANAAGIPLPFS